MSNRISFGDKETMRKNNNNTLSKKKASRNLQVTGNRGMEGRVPQSWTTTVYPSINQSCTYYDGQQPLNQHDLASTDITTVALGVPSVGTIIDLTATTQGSGDANRQGAAIELSSIVMNYSVVTQNSDLFSTVRIIVFQWLLDSNLVAPIVSDILQTAGVLQMHNWSRSRDYRILYDNTIFQTGLASAPCDAGFQGATGVIIPLNSIKPTIIYSAATDGTGKVYMLLISDSVVAPFPTWSSVVRTIFRP